MVIDWVDVVAVYLYALKYIAIGVALIIFILGIDDLVIDVAYWLRRIWRGLRVYRRYPKADARVFDPDREQPIAIMVPAWHEADVIGSMLTQAVQSIAYENYHIFVGVYPNDPDTAAVVDPICRSNPNIHKVVCARPGPTTKADCLNNVIQAIFAFEKQIGLNFAGFVLHDSEDVIGSLELRVFNHLLPRKDLIQLPVYPLPVPWHHITAWHYADEFAEQHGKDMVIREGLLGQVPSAGVGTCFSRRALLRLMTEYDGQPFDVRALTEDYEIAMRLYHWGMKQVFVRFPADTAATRRAAVDHGVIAIRAHFPDRFRTAVRQKSRWILGIMLQGWRNVRWRGGPLMKYFLWRDRRGLFGHPIAFIANFLLLQLLVLWLYQALAPGPWRFLSIFGDDRLLVALLYANGVLLLNRILHRIWFTSRFYGVAQGLLAVPRLFWANLINVVAMARALYQFIRAGRGGKLQWDKTAHTFPAVEATPPVRPLGEILVEHGVVGHDAIEQAITDRRIWERLGQTLLRHGAATPAAIAAALAEQAGTEYYPLDPRRLDRELLARVPAAVARRYAVVPVAERAGALIVASESALPAVELNALRRRLQRAVEYVIAPQGSVTVALRRYYHDARDTPDPWDRLQGAVEMGVIDGKTAETLWQRYVSGQFMLGSSLVRSGLLLGPVAHQALIDYEHSSLPFGEYLVEAGYISRATLDDALRHQREDQPDMTRLLAEANAGDEPVPVAGASRE